MGAREAGSQALPRPLFRGPGRVRQGLGE